MWQALHSQELRADVRTFNAMLLAFSKQPQMHQQRAQQLWSQMQQQQVRPDVVSYSLMISVTEECGLTGQANSLYGKAVKLNLLPLWEKRADGRKFSIDLHRLTVPVARVAVRYAVTEGMQDFIPGDLRIITGVGKHSKHLHQPALRPEIQRMLVEDFSPPLSYHQEKHLACSSDSSSCVQTDNRGCLVVSKETLFTWSLRNKNLNRYVIRLPPPPEADLSSLCRIAY